MNQRAITLTIIAFALFASGFSLGLRLGLRDMLNSAIKARVVVFNQQSKKFEWIKPTEFNK
jgi:hypothetical protein